jgi:hypothetical protein
MKKIALILLMTAFLLPAYAGKERLVGTFKSNKPATMAYLKTHTKLNSKQLEKLGTVLGKMTVTVDKQTVTYRNGDWKFVSNYRIVEETPSVIIIESQNPQNKKWERMEIEPDSKGFWAPDDQIPGYKERFDKIEK